MQAATWCHNTGPDWAVLHPTLISTHAHLAVANAHALPNAVTPHNGQKLFVGGPHVSLRLHPPPPAVSTVRLHWDVNLLEVRIMGTI